MAKKKATKNKSATKIPQSLRMDVTAGVQRAYDELCDVSFGDVRSKASALHLRNAIAALAGMLGRIQ